MKLTKLMIAMLQDIYDGFGTHGTASEKGEHIGRYSTARALRDRGLIGMDNELTDAGYAALVNAKAVQP